MTLEAKACQACTDQCRLEKRSDSILNSFNDGDISQAQALQRVSTMTQEARQIGCPKEEMLRVRWETQAQIDPKIAEADKRRNAIRTPAPSSEVVDVYFRENRDQKKL